MESNKPISVLLVDGGDRQTVSLAKAYKDLGYKVTTLNNSKLDVGYSSKYPDRKLLYRNIKNNRKAFEKVLRVCAQSNEYDVFVTSSDDTAELLSLLRQDYGSMVSVLNPQLFYSAYDKSITMKICMDNGIPCPKTYLNIKNYQDIPWKELQYPLVIKPKKSYGAIGFNVINSENEMMAFCTSNINDLNNYLIQEYIPQTDIQYECAIFVDNNNSVQSACVFSKNRWFPVKGGSSTCNVTVERPDIIQSCSSLLKVMNWRGVADIDLILDPRDKTAKIMEINPRVSGSIKVVQESGVNIAHQIVQLSMGEEVTSYMDYKKDVRMRCIHTDILWFLKSPKRFNSSPSWFSWKNTIDQIWSINDPLPFLTFSIQSLLKLKKELDKRS